MAHKLSRHKIGGEGRGKPSSLIRVCNKKSYVVVFARVLNSVSLLEWATAFCFFEV